MALAMAAPIPALVRIRPAGTSHSIGLMPAHRVTPPTPAPGEKLKGPASYFASIEKNYGRPVQEWLDLVADRLDSHTHMEVVGWLKSDHGMGHGHANAIVAYARAELAR